MHILQLKDVEKTFIQSHLRIALLHSCSSLFEQGKTYGLVGSSGIGKSTLMHLLAGIDTPTKGAVLLDGNDIQTLPEKKRASTVRLVTQTPHMIKELTAYENCKLASDIAGIAQAVTQERLDELFALLELSHTKNWNVGQLSGGQLQRISLIRALVTRPAFLLADEPTGSLDQKTGEQLIQLLLTCQKKWGIGLIISSHNNYVIKQMEIVFTIENGILTPVLRD